MFARDRCAGPFTQPTCKPDANACAPQTCRPLKFGLLTCQ